MSVLITTLLSSSVSGYSGYSGAPGPGTSGFSGYSGPSGFSGISGFSGSGVSASAISATNDNITSSSVYPVWVSVIGTISTAKASSASLYFVPSTGVLSATEFTSLSDENQKENIQTITNSLDKVLALRGVSFNWKDNKNNSIGLIAQEVEKVVPEAVHTQNGEKTINYNALIGILVEAIKELNSKLR